MHFVIHAVDMKDALPVRAKHYRDHRIHLDHAGDHGVAVMTAGTLVAADGSVPWRYDHLADYTYGVSGGLLFDLSPGDIHAALARDGSNTFLLLTRSEGNNASLLYGVPRDWLGQITDALGNSAGFRVVYRNSDAVVVHLLVGGERA